MQKTTAELPSPTIALKNLTLFRTLSRDRKFYRVCESRGTETGRCILVSGPKESVSHVPGVVFGLIWQRLRVPRSVDFVNFGDYGWRSGWWFYLEHDPNLDSIRSDPRLQSVLEEVRADMAKQSARVRAMEADGRLEPIPEDL